jgi:ribonuclease P/MRP protein subunit POP8
MATSEANVHEQSASESTKTSTQIHKERNRQNKTHALTRFTIRNPRWCYIHLQHLTTSTSNAPADLDAVTAHLHLTAALSQFLGIHGSAVPIDIMKLSGQDVWTRVPAEDRNVLVAAAGGWVSRNGEGWRVKGWSSWNAGAEARDAGQKLFGD